MSTAQLHGEIPAPDAVLTRLGDTAGVRIVDHDCRKPAGARGTYEYGHDFGLVLIRRGGYWREVRGRGAYLGPTDAFFERPFVEQRFDHHGDRGDRCTSLWLSEAAVCALAGDGFVPDAPLTTTPAIDLCHRELVAGLRHGIDRFELDERLAILVGSIAERGAPGRFTARRSASRTRHERLVQGAREAIIADPAGVDLAAVAAVAGHTRFHLSRIFSLATGMTMAAFRNRVRVAIALDCLADGHVDLVGLAADLGFVDQSHLTRVVRAAIGAPPGALRSRLARSAAAQAPGATGGVV